MSDHPIIFSRQYAAPYVPLSKRKGTLTFALTNDYLFKTVMQRDETILSGLLCSLFSLTPGDIRSIVITNALIPGQTVSAKDTVLDLRMLLNHNRIINVEMQIKDEHNWPERSLTYLCRDFDNLKEGQNYADVIPAHHVDILSFNPPGMPKEFYGHYYVMNPKTHAVFTDKFRLSVLNLKQAELATDNDRQHRLEKWAAALNASTWEEFNMLAEDDILFQKVAEAVYLVSENQEIAKQCRRRNEAIAEQKRWEAEQRQWKAEQQNWKAEKQNWKAEKQQWQTDQQQWQADQRQWQADQRQWQADQRQWQAEQQQWQADQQQWQADQQRMANTILQKEQALLEKNSQIEALQAELAHIRAHQQPAKK